MKLIIICRMTFRPWSHENMAMWLSVTTCPRTTRGWTRRWPRTVMYC